MPSGWFPDPLDRYDHRYFNGVNWTSDVSQDGVRHVDPLGARPTGTAGSPNDGNRAATAAVVTGSIAIAIAWIPFIVVIGIVLAVLAVVFGVRGLRQSRINGTGRGASLAGIIMGGLGIGAAVVGIVLSVVVWRAVVDYVEPGAHDVAVTSCEIDGRDIHVAGTIENQSDSPQEYTVFVDVEGRTASAIVDTVAPGGTSDWSTTVTTRSVADTCDPEVVVHGPFPFDLELDPVN